MNVALEVGHQRHEANAVERGSLTKEAGLLIGHCQGRLAQLLPEAGESS
jgi:hypothetical protein